jgi:hypothetical protein
MWRWRKSAKQVDKELLMKRLFQGFARRGKKHSGGRFLPAGKNRTELTKVTE